MIDTGHADHETEAPTTVPAESTPGRSARATPQAGHDMDSRMMWVVMIGCGLAIPLALIIGGASLWLIGAGAGAVLAVALVVTRRILHGPRYEALPDHHG